MTVIPPSDRRADSRRPTRLPEPLSDFEPQVQDDPVADGLRRRRLALLASAAPLLAAVLWAACYLTVLAPADGPAASAAADLPADQPADQPADPWGPHPLQAETQRVAALLRSFRRGEWHVAERRETAPPPAAPSPAGLEPSVRLLVDKGWPTLRPAAIPAVAQATGIAGEIGGTPQRATP